MAFLGDLVVKLSANISPFQFAIKKAKDVTAAFQSSLMDMRTTASVFSKLAASIKAVNNQMDRLVHVSKGALAATNNMASAEQNQFKLRMQQLKMIAAAQRSAQPQSPSGGSMMGAGIAGGIAGGLTSMAGGVLSSGASMVADMGIATVRLAADAETAQMQFSVLLGNAEKGKKMFKDIEKFALRTSFNIESASDATTRLLATGVAEDKVITTLQLLGDLSLGDANKLGFLSKAYTDVMNKGKLQAQETKQFSENGIGLMAALSATTGKTVSELTKMQEEGAITFQMVQEALLGLTTGTGRFAGAMEGMNKTFTGQWNSMLEAVQGFGRDLGALVLPTLKSMVEEVNKFLQAFRGMDDKAKFLGDILSAGMDVGIETIREHWDLLLGEMVLKGAAAAQKIAKYMDPTVAIGSFIGGGVGRSVAGQGAMPGQSPLQAAQDRLRGVMGRLNQNAPVPEKLAPLIDPNVKPDGSKLSALAGSIAEGAKGLFDQIANAAAKKATGLAVTGDWLASVGSNMLGVNGDAITPDKAKKDEAKTAGAMQKGSAEAFSTIVQAMMGLGKDPNVKATEKQTKDLVKAIKGQKGTLLNLVAEFVG